MFDQSNRHGAEEVVYALVRRRIALGLTQQSMADRLKITRPAISMFESPTKRVPLLSTVVRYAEALGVTLTLTIQESTGV